MMDVVSMCDTRHKTDVVNQSVFYHVLPYLHKTRGSVSSGPTTALKLVEGISFLCREQMLSGNC